MKQADSGVDGLLVVDKPLSITSMDVVRVVRRRAGKRKTGHAGTLDPLATGVLICCLGKATRAVNLLMDLTKEYRTTIDLSAFTKTDDAEGEREPVEVESPPGVDQIREVLDTLTGDVTQVPPMYSAIKVGGERAYKLARKGHDVEMPPRVVRIDEIRLLDYDWPSLEIEVVAGKGTYIRSLARQIGEGLGTGGYLTALRRTAIGPYSIDRAIKLDDVPTPITPELLLPIPASTGSNPNLKL